MSTLYEITTDYLTLAAMADDPDIDPQVLQDTLEAVEGDLEVKADNYARIIANLSTNIASIIGKAEAFQEEAERLKATAKRLADNADRMKENLKKAMELTDKTKFQTLYFRFSVVKNPPKLVIDDKDKIPKKYLIPQEPKVDTATIKKDIKEKAVKWAHLESTTRLAIK